MTRWRRLQWFVGVRRQGTLNRQIERLEAKLARWRAWTARRAPPDATPASLPSKPGALS